LAPRLSLSLGLGLCLARVYGLDDEIWIDGLTQARAEAELGINAAQRFDGFSRGGAGQGAEQEHDVVRGRGVWEHGHGRGRIGHWVVGQPRGYKPSISEHFLLHR
jgi:hypothetical protein